MPSPSLVLPHCSINSSINILHYFDAAENNMYFEVYNTWYTFCISISTASWRPGPLSAVILVTEKTQCTRWSNMLLVLLWSTGPLVFGISKDGLPNSSGKSTVTGSRMNCRVTTVEGLPSSTGLNSSWGFSTLNYRSAPFRRIFISTPGHRESVTTILPAYP